MKLVLLGWFIHFADFACPCCLFPFAVVMSGSGEAGGEMECMYNIWMFAIFLRWSYHEVGISRVRKSEFPLEGRLRLIAVVWKWHDFS